MPEIMNVVPISERVAPAQLNKWGSNMASIILNPALQIKLSINGVNIDGYYDDIYRERFNDSTSSV